MIGSSCRLYKNCRICRQTKWYQEFESNGGRGRKRKSYCKKCKSKKSELFTSSQLQYQFDTQLLKQEDINVRLKLRSNRRIQYTVSYEQAILMVNEGMAGIVHETLIHKLYDIQAFKAMILERDNGICQYCGGYGNTVDHINPKSEGGISSFNNCLCSCQKCNKNKGSLPLEDFLFYIEPMDVSGNVKDGRLVQQLQYLVQSLECMNDRILNDGFSEEQSFEQIHQIIERVENSVGKLKVDMLEMGKIEISAT